MTLVGPYLAACLLLVLAGAAKLARPAPTANALATVLGPKWQWRRSVRPAGAAEIAAGLIGLIRPSAVTAGVIAGIYICFAGFVVLARKRGGRLASCGCFGAPDTPATRLHVIINVAFAASASAVAATARSHWISAVLSGQPAKGVPLALGASLLAVLAATAMTLLPRLQAAQANLR